MVSQIKSIRYLVTLLLLLYTTLSFAQGQLSIELSRHEIELGKHVLMTLKAPSSLPSLDSIDLTELAKTFHINKLADVEIDQGRQSWKFRLHPYRTGKHTLPRLHFHDYASEEIDKETYEEIYITVNNAIDPKSKKPLFVNYSVSTSTPWVRQQVLVTYQLTSSLRQYDLKITKPNDSKFISHNLSLEESVLENNNGDIYQYRTGFALFNLKSGPQQLELPPLVIKRDGTTTHRFYPAPIDLAVKALPAYLPATVPVGRLSLKMDSGWHFTFTQTLSNIEIGLIGHHVQLRHLPDIAYQLSSTDSIQTYPDLREEQQSDDANGLTSRIQYTIPLKSISQGIHSLQTIRLLHFDPVSGTLQSRRYELPMVISLHKWLVIGIGLLLLAVIAYVLIRLFQYLRYQFIRYRYYRLALQQLSNATDANHIRSAMKLICKAESLSQNISPQQWLGHFSSTVNTKRQDQLNMIFYHKMRHDIQIVVELKHIIKSNHSIFNH